MSGLSYGPTSDIEMKAGDAKVSFSHRKDKAVVVNRMMSNIYIEQPTG